MYFKKVSVTEKLPQLNKFVTTIDEAGEHRVYRRVQNNAVNYYWNVRDADGKNSPDNNLPITHWLEEVNDSEVIDKAEKWDKLAEKISTFYFDEEGNELEDVCGDLCDIGEAAASAFGWL